MEEIDLKSRLLSAFSIRPTTYKKGLKETFKVRLFDPSKYEIVDETDTHLRFNCPFCIEVRGKFDNDGKFYFDKDKQIGYCFKCTTVGVMESDKDISEIELDRSISKLAKLKTKDEEPYVFSSINYEKMFDLLDKEGLDYLDSRTPFYASFADKLRFKVSPNTGIIVPLRYWGKDISYNLRFYNPRNKMKYFIPSEVKYLYSPNNVFCKEGCFKEITLVEGYFDAIGAFLDGYPNPIALFGLSITPLQIEMLRSISPIKIRIYLDEAKLSWQLYWKLKGKFPTCEKIEIVPTNYDPEERFIFNFKRCNKDELVKLIKRLEKLYNEGFYNDNPRID